MLCGFLWKFLGNMEGPEVTFLFQFGNLRDMVTVPAATINLRSLKDLACDFINSKVSAKPNKRLIHRIRPVELMVSHPTSNTERVSECFR